ncbi:MAG: glycosyltransferase family 9 protein, partial [Bacteroidota bacterium]
KWVELIDNLRSDLSVYLIGAPGDLEMCADIRDKSVHGNVRILAGELTFLQSAALMKDARMNFVNDSAPMHIASAVNAPVTAIYCSTIQEFGFGPLSDDSRIIETKESLECRPCGLHGKKACPKGHFKCATTIETKEIIDFGKNKARSISG